MKPDEIIYEWIDRYLTGQLVGEELSAFTEKLASDATFYLLVENQKAANTIILGNRLAQIKQQMDADFRSKDTKRNLTKWGISGLLGISVVICTLVYRSDIPESEPTAPQQINDPKFASVNRSSKHTEHPAEEKTLSSNIHTGIYRPAETTDSGNKKSLPDLNPNAGFDTNTTSYIQKTGSTNFNEAVAEEQKINTNQFTDTHPGKPKTELCQGVTIEAVLTIDAACANKYDGEIQIAEHTVKGGLAPYTYTLINKTNDTVRQQSPSFVSLHAGQYTLFFEDANRCLSAYKKPLYVHEKSCTAPAQSFSPRAGERFEYPVSGDSDADITIYNRGGQAIYKTHLQRGASDFWEGTNQNGQLLSAGVYIYIIEYVSGIKETGEVVLF